MPFLLLHNLLHLCLFRRRLFRLPLWVRPKHISLHESVSSSLSLSLSLCFFCFHWNQISWNRQHAKKRSLSPTLSLSISFSICFFLSISPSISFSLSISFFLFLSLYLFIYFYLFLSFSISLSISFSLLSLILLLPASVQSSATAFRSLLFSSILILSHADYYYFDIREDQCYKTGFDVTDITASSYGNIVMSALSGLGIKEFASTHKIAPFTQWTIFTHKNWHSLKFRISIWLYVGTAAAALQQKRRKGFAASFTLESRKLDRTRP